MPRIAQKLKAQYRAPHKFVAGNPVRHDDGRAEGNCRSNHPAPCSTIDERGAPVRIVATDPRVFAAHKLWLSKQADRAPTRRRRDASQAEVVAQLVARYLAHLPYQAGELRMIPRPVFEDAQPLFRAEPASDDFSL